MLCLRWNRKSQLNYFAEERILFGAWNLFWVYGSLSACLLGQQAFFFLQRSSRANVGAQQSFSSFFCNALILWCSYKPESLSCSWFRRCVTIVGRCELLCGDLGAKTKMCWCAMHVHSDWPGWRQKCLLQSLFTTTAFFWLSGRTQSPTCLWNIIAQKGTKFANMLWRCTLHHQFDLSSWSIKSGSLETLKGSQVKMNFKWRFAPYLQTSCHK